MEQSASITRYVRFQHQGPVAYGIWNVTGTPGQTQQVVRGDTIEIEGIGRLRNTVAGA